MVVLEEERAWISLLLSVLVFCHLYLMTLLHTRCPVTTVCVCSCDFFHTQTELCCWLLNRRKFGNFVCERGVNGYY